MLGVWSGEGSFTWKPPFPHLWNENGDSSYFVWVVDELKACICRAVSRVLRRGWSPTTYSSAAAAFPLMDPFLLTLCLPTGHTSNVRSSFFHSLVNGNNPRVSPKCPPALRGREKLVREDLYWDHSGLANLRLNHPCCFRVSLVAFYPRGSERPGEENEHMGINSPIPHLHWWIFAH